MSFTRFKNPISSSDVFVFDDFTHDYTISVSLLAFCPNQTSHVSSQLLLDFMVFLTVCHVYLLSVRLFVYHSICVPSVCLSIHPYVSLSVVCQSAIYTGICMSVILQSAWLSISVCVCCLLVCCLFICLSSFSRSVVCPSVHQSVSMLSVHLSICPVAIFQSVCPSTCLSMFVHQSVCCLSVYLLSVHLSVCLLSFSQSVRLSVYLSIVY